MKKRKGAVRMKHEGLTDGFVAVYRLPGPGLELRSGMFLRLSSEKGYNT